MFVKSRDLSYRHAASVHVFLSRCTGKYLVWKLEILTKNYRLSTCFHFQSINIAIFSHLSELLGDASGFKQCSV